MTVASNATDLRRTAAWAKLGKYLFTEEVLRLNPATIAQLLRQAGVPVPKGVMVAADTAQIIASGGAFIDALDSASTTSSYMIPATATIQATLDLMKMIGWLDGDSPVGQWLTLGADTAAVVASDGLNVIADLKLALDIFVDVMDIASSMKKAESHAWQNLEVQLRNRRRVQSTAAAVNFKDYQEQKMSAFKFMGKIAEESPDLFANFFPYASTFFPPTYVAIASSATDANMFGTNTFTAWSWIKTIQNDHSNVVQTLWTKIIQPCLIPFKRLNDNQKQNGGISVKTLALLSMLPPYLAEYPLGACVLPYMFRLGLTPHDFGENAIGNQIHASRISETPALTLNAVDYMSTKVIDLRELDSREKLLIRSDEMGSIPEIIKYSDLTQLNNWGTPDWPAGIVSQTLNGQKYFVKLTNENMLTQPVRNIQNYWGALAMLEQIRGDSYFSEVSNQIEQYNFFPELEEMNKMHRDLLFKIQCRRLNFGAVKNIASFLGTTVNKLKIKSAPQPGRPTIFT